jgi:hypothetical protein
VVGKQPASSRRRLFKQADLSRALRAALSAGMKPCRAAIDQSGNIVLDFEGSAPAEPETPFDLWKGKRGASAT